MSKGGATQCLVLSKCSVFEDYHYTTSAQPMYSGYRQFKIRMAFIWGTRIVARLKASDFNVFFALMHGQFVL